MAPAGEFRSTVDPRQFHLALLHKYRLRPDRKLGQHFLVDPVALDRVVSAAGLSGVETVLEIGAGLGALTDRLAARAREVVAVEYDRRLLAPLQEAVGHRSNVRLVSADILEVDLRAYLGSKPYRVVANIPYQITSLLLRRFLERQPVPDRLVLTIQREVAERVVSGPGELSLLALGVQMYGEPSIQGRIPAGSFLPPPGVDSAILRVDVHAHPVVAQELVEPVFRLARAGFAQKRKKLRNALAAGLAVSTEEAETRLREAGIDPSARAETLGLPDWQRLAERWDFKSGGSKAG
ncbi:MAG TPA: 16S rRNA (adenine(1518)-N(6)/adenine(1519)-N(6))-dimethyltransferase RsmA [Anaerolineales bacterium]|nr:16S rRNA (adenine(1518)-N(6)/adenine(1519)-N(6))-dimethyltransferase RsmA [Anaerolineales bacterium]